MPTRFTHNSKNDYKHEHESGNEKRKVSVDKVCVHGDRITDGTDVGYI
ncbi:hypothetical protein VCRA2117O380_20460 [Vibrio crassostreae]|nr:hypothetical protein VCRA2119O381_230031 [Vibrio crassostreae]CAK2024584.1 hypothetical protein VCRA2117O379_20461 [Vibrio crassostreae]CAK2027753.1 hypothetical protein VCRA2117O380_20460 [Vibrio crassostreae]CAK2487590.1 hypothetical protein VCRA2113O350_20461 [Vibrio crassostreae]CAK2783873.1 hypothetical protein VCRA2119O385_20032 [Vibrio crassostreae]